MEKITHYTRRLITILGTIAPKFIAMTYPSDALFDIETLINVAQAENILLLGDGDASFLNNYCEQKSVLGQESTVTQIHTVNIDLLWQTDQQFGVAIAFDLFEHLDKVKGMQVLSRLRDVLSPQYCICLPINSSAENSWQLTDLFSFALSKVASYHVADTEYGLFKYNLSDYKKTPDWLNADNWANPKMWGKYWW